MKMKRWSQRILAWEQFLEVLDVLVEVLEVCTYAVIARKQWNGKTIF